MVKRISGSFTAALMLVELLSLPLQADEYRAEDDFFGEAPVVLTVARMSKPLANSPVSVSVIDRQMIRNSGAREVADIFRMVPGFLVGYRLGHTPAVAYQGLGSNWQRQLQVFIDGRSVFIPSFGGVPWANLPLLLQDIERVEISRGPNAATYGANAFFATINIITRHAAEDYGVLLSLTRDLNEDNEVSDFYFRAGNQQGDFDWRLTAGRISDDGYRNEHDSKRVNIINFRSDFLTTHNQFWSVQLGINLSNFDRGDGDVADIIREEEARNSYQNIKWEWIEDDVSTTTLLTHTRQDVNDDFVTARLNQELDALLGSSLFDSLPQDITLDIDFGRISDRLDLEWFQSRQLSARSKLVYGASLRQDEVRSSYLFSDKELHTVNTQRLFGSMEIQLDRVLLDAGLMLENSDLVKNKLSGRLSAIQSIGLRHKLRAVISTAHRNPILAEIEGNIQAVIELPALPGLPTEIPQIRLQGNPALQPETITSVEIGLFSEFANRQLSTDLRLFRYHIDDQIIELYENDVVGGIPQSYRLPQNAVESTVRGLEASFNFSPRHKQYRLYGGWSRVFADVSDAGFEDSYPSSTAFVGGHINFLPAHQLSATAYHVGAMSWIDSSRQLEGYDKFDLRYQWTLNRESETRLELIGYNLLDQSSEYLNRNMQEKMWLVRLSSQF